MPCNFHQNFQILQDIKIQQELTRRKRPPAPPSQFIIDQETADRSTRVTLVYDSLHNLRFTGAV